MTTLPGCCSHTVGFTLPAAYTSHVHVHEVGISIVADTAALEAQRGVPHSGGDNSRQANVDGFRLHVEAVTSDPRVRAAGTQEFVAPGCAVSTDDIDLAAGMVQGRRQV